jgi:hypothetical protein
VSDNILTHLQPPKQHISLPTGPAATLKVYLVHIGLEALRDGDHDRVDEVTQLLRELGVAHA